MINDWHKNDSGSMNMTITKTVILVWIWWKLTLAVGWQLEMAGRWQRLRGCDNDKK